MTAERNDVGELAKRADVFVMVSLLLSHLIHLGGDAADAGKRPVFTCQMFLLNITRTQWGDV